jgi:type II secretion system protein C
MVLYVAYLAAGLVHTALEKDAPRVALRSAAGQPVAGAGIGKGKFLTFDPFYRSLADVEALAEATDSLPESSLQIEVFGLRASAEGAGSAIVKLQGSDQKLVQVGEEIRAGIRLVGVYADRLELSRAGTREAVYLKPQEKREAFRSSMRKPVPPRRISSKNTALSSAAEKILSNIKALNLEPVRRERRIIGFRLPEELPQIAGMMGFEPEDILLAINGEPLNSFERLTELEEELGSARELAVEIERRGEVRQVAVGPLGN